MTMKPYYYQGHAIATPFTIESNKPLFVSESVSLKQNRYSQQAQRWELSFQLVGRGDMERDLLVTSVTDLETPQTMIMPQLNITNTAGANPEVETYSESLPSSAAVGATSVPCSPGLGNAILLSRGSFVQFDNDTKVYMLTSHRREEHTTIEIFPPLRKAVSSSESMLGKDNVILTYFLDESNLRGVTYVDGVIVDPGVIRILEAL